MLNAENILEKFNLDIARIFFLIFSLNKIVAF